MTPATSAIPPACLEVITPLIRTARALLEDGEALVPVALVGSLETGRTIPVMMNAASEEAKDGSALVLKRAAESIDADFVFVMMEAWSLRPDKARDYQAILARYGSIGQSPYKVDIVSMVLETSHGVWLAQVPIKPSGDSRKRRSFGEPDFVRCDGMAGRFTGLLPKNKRGAEPTTLH